MHQLSTEQQTQAQAGSGKQINIEQRREKSSSHQTCSVFVMEQTNSVQAAEPLGPYTGSTIHVFTIYTLYY